MKDILNEHERTISIVRWQDIRQSVYSVNKELGVLIDALDPSDDYKFIEADYKYGDVFIENSAVKLPQEDGQLVSILDNKISKEIKKELHYSTMPLFLTMTQDNEVFINSEARAIPLNLFHKGSFGGTYEAMDFMMGYKSKAIWNYSAGARSICMLPKITNKQGLQRLFTVYNIPSTTPINSLSDHWNLFKLIAQSPNFDQRWNSKILYFGAKWLTNTEHSTAWHNFRMYMLKEIWRQTALTIDKLKFNLYWEKFLETIAIRRLQPRPYLLNQVKHIISIMRGDLPGFIPADMTQSAGPIDGLQRAFTDVYMLKEYIPTILHGCLLNDEIKKLKYVYYSLALPTVLEGSPVNKSTFTIVSDMRQIKLLLDTLKDYMLGASQLTDSDTSLQDKFHCFHSDKDKYHEIDNSNIIPKEDPTFLSDAKKFPKKIFCHTSPFFSGCIRIKK